MKRTISLFAISLLALFCLAPDAAKDLKPVPEKRKSRQA